MKCELVRNLMSSYIDQKLNEIEKKEFEKHLAVCSDCMKEYEQMLEIVTISNNIEEVELPESFKAELHEKLLTEKAKNTGSFLRFVKKHRYKTASGLAAAVLILAIFLSRQPDIVNQLGILQGTNNAARGSEQYGMTKGAPDVNNGLGGNAPSTAYNATMDTQFTTAASPEAKSIAPAPEIAKVDGNSGNLAISFNEAINPLASRGLDTSTRKVIKSGNITLKSKNFDTRVNEIKQLTETNGGFVENSSIDNVVVYTTTNPVDGKPAGESTMKTANITIRIPADKFDIINEQIKGMGQLVNESINGNDITSQYQDTYTRKENLKVQEKRLQELMAKANNVDEILRIENELNRVRTDIDMMEGSLKQWDNLVELSTLNISITEVKEEKLQTVDVPNIWQKAYLGLIGTINDILSGSSKLFIIIITIIPYLLILGALTAVVLFIIKRRKGKK